MKGYFQGWYFKQQKDGHTLALIPAIHMDNSGKKTASLQVITEKYSKSILYPTATISHKRGHLEMRMGENRFSEKGIYLNVYAADISISGILSFGELKRPRYDIMGPFAMLPGMQCRHSVLSLTHTVNGGVNLNGEEMDFHGANGYIEGDRGCSFPSRYLWTQCCFGNGNSLMLAVGSIPLHKRSFDGIIGIVYLGGKEYRIATYCGARLVELKGEKVVVKQGNLCFTAELLKYSGLPLCAPNFGQMTRIIRESAECTVRYRFTRGNDTLLDFVSQHACFEKEW